MLENDIVPLALGAAGNPTKNVNGYHAHQQEEQVGHQTQGHQQDKAHP